MDFDAINKMSSSLIEQLQEEVDFYRSQINVAASPKVTRESTRDYTFQRRTEGRFNESVNEQSIIYNHGPLMFKTSNLLNSPPSQGQGVDQKIQENTLKEITGYLDPHPSYTPERGGKFS